MPENQYHFMLSSGLLLHGHLILLLLFLYQKMFTKLLIQEIILYSIIKKNNRLLDGNI